MWPDPHEHVCISPQKCVRVFIHSLSFATLAVLYFVAPVMIFQQYEGWSYAEAVYYCFITLSTIGFGDYVAGEINSFLHLQPLMFFA